jgi:DNA polymerase III epsilon subunit-like protein
MTSMPAPFGLASPLPRTWPLPPQYLVLDLETTAGDPTEAEEWMRWHWSPNPNWSPPVVGARFHEALEKKKEKLALLPTAPILSVALKTEQDCRVLHTLPFAEPALSSAVLERYESEREMLARLAQLLAECSPETTLVGHNIRHFDLPKIRGAMLRHGVRLPACLVHRDHPIYDTLVEWGRYTLDTRPMVSLAEVLTACGIASHKQDIDGSQVPALYERGQYHVILSYAVLDVLAQWRLFLRMTGQEEP